ncbi:hypothetical protein GCM10010112_69400 [Actinoplanes lobatus]|uniref:Uncharacterized protein n=1 Tax=Actinoplanes lobatus TaxID=113568 RepID=A0A7W7HM43_9ACTN|nr:hypothetical protein [Actinoplanes lobatus]MBB4753083.1 hypothetical protein [Actinoplanes lobatus]GGN87125.1 hypothetical protein GCM10010112_69400 [Actinoplanes lobatus]GIE39690.1 hypothetical protein Alo02nite_25880 [Actinoplanes lobatus]
MWSARRRTAVLTALSVLAGTVVGMLTNIVTDRPGPAVAGGLAVAIVAAVTLAVLLARAGESPAPESADHVQLADRGHILDTHVDVGPGSAARTRQEARDGGSITGSSIVIRSHSETPPPPRPGPALPGGTDPR